MLCRKLPLAAFLLAWFSEASCYGRGRPSRRGSGYPRQAPVKQQQRQFMCPSCEQAITSKNMKRHMAFCSPDLLDPEGWAAADQQVVVDHIKALHHPQ